MQHLHKPTFFQSEGDWSNCTDFSGVSRVWQAWLVPWAAFGRGCKNCLAQIKISDFCFFNFCFALHATIHCMHSCIDIAPLSNAITRACCASITKDCEKTVVLWHTVTSRSDTGTDKNARLRYLQDFVLLTL